MKLIEVLYNFFNGISSYFQKILLAKNVKALPESTAIFDVECLAEESFDNAQLLETDEVIEVDEISLAKRTLMTNLYSLEQQMEVFKERFPKQYELYLKRINDLREKYNKSLDALSSKMTFEIDPEFNGLMRADIKILEREINSFIHRELKFDEICEKLKRLICKLNILYNASIKHPRESAKVISQLQNLLEIEDEIVRDFKSNQYFLSNFQLKERIVTLLSYMDYQIFKTNLRNSKNDPQSVFETLLLLKHFKDFDFATVFKAFLEDELSDLRELVDFIPEEQYRKRFDNKISSLLNEIAYTTDLKTFLNRESLWKNIFELESSLLELLRNVYSLKVDKEQIKIKIIDKLNIDTNDSEVCISPKAETYLALNSLYSSTHDERISLVIKFLKNVSDEVTYKEIYFLLLLFGVMEIVKTNYSSLKHHVGQYIIKYSYDNQKIMRKKEQVLISTSEKQYVKAFDLDDNIDEVVSTLSREKFDFELRDDGVYINYFYFDGLANVFPSITQQS